MICKNCGYDDNGTGDFAHACKPYWPMLSDGHSSEAGGRVMNAPYQRRVVCAANLDPIDGTLIVGARHWDSLMNMQASHWLLCDFTKQGFIDQHGVFMDRREAWQVATAAGQIIRRVGGDDADGGTLYSENLY